MSLLVCTVSSPNSYVGSRFSIPLVALFLSQFPPDEPSDPRQRSPKRQLAVILPILNCGEFHPKQGSQFRLGDFPLKAYSPHLATQIPPYLIAVKYGSDANNVGSVELEYYLSCDGTSTFRRCLRSMRILVTKVVSVLIRWTVGASVGFRAVESPNCWEIVPQKLCLCYGLRSKDTIFRITLLDQNLFGSKIKVLMEKRHAKPGEPVMPCEDLLNL